MDDERYVKLYHATGRGDFSSKYKFGKVSTVADSKRRFL